MSKYRLGYPDYFFVNHACIGLLFIAAALLFYYVTPCCRGITNGEQVLIAAWFGSGIYWLYMFIDYPSTVEGKHRNLDFDDTTLHVFDCKHGQLGYRYTTGGKYLRIGRGPGIVRPSKSHYRRYECRYLEDATRIIPCTKPFVGQYCHDGGTNGFCESDWNYHCSTLQWSPHLSGCLNRFLDRNVPKLTLTQRKKLTVARLVTLLEEPEDVLRQHVYTATTST